MDLGKDFDAFLENIYRNNVNSFVAYAEHILKDAELAKDAVQESFRIACCKPNEIMNSPNPAGWLMNTLKYVIRRIRLHQKAVEKLFITYCFEEAEEYEQELNVDILYSGLISKEDFDLLKLVIFEKYTIREAAQEMGISPDACKKRIQRAKNKLREILKNEEFF